MFSRLQWYVPPSLSSPLFPLPFSLVPPPCHPFLSPSPSTPFPLFALSPRLMHPTGEQNFQAASSYVSERFLELNDNKHKTIYAHMTCATDTTNIIIVFNAVRDIILNKTLVKIGVVM
jgi:hypothetical protein